MKSIILRRFGSAIHLPIFVKLSEKHNFIFLRIFDVHKHWHFKPILLFKPMLGLNELFESVALIFTGSSSVADFQMHPHSVGAELLSAQRMDEIGVLKAHNMYKTLSANLAGALGSPDFLIHSSSDLPVTVEERAKLHSLRNYLLAATFKDCSVMISMQRRQNVNEDESQNAMDILLSTGIRVDYDVRLIDLDQKLVGKLATNAHIYTNGQLALQNRVSFCARNI